MKYIDMRLVIIEILKQKGLSSILELVPGIGEVRKKELLKKFGSLKKMKEASLEELSKVVGEEVARSLQDYLKEMDKDS